MEGDTKETGNKITCMAKVSTLGKTGEYMKANILTIKNKGLAFTRGQTGDAT